MSTPIDLAAERLRRMPEYDGKVCECGCAWWEARVLFNQHGYVHNVSTFWAKCSGCGAEADWLPEGVV